MRNRLILSIVVLLALVLAWRACRPLPATPLEIPPPADTVVEAQSPEATGTADAGLIDDGARSQALASAKSAVHAYLAALAGPDPQQADQWWAKGRPGRSRGDAILRTKEPLRSLRITSASARPLDADPVPRVVEVPVRLRLGLADGSTRLVQGDYRLRARKDGEGWEITSAALQAELPGRH